MNDALVNVAVTVSPELELPYLGIIEKVVVLKEPNNKYSIHYLVRFKDSPDLVDGLLGKTSK